MNLRNRKLVITVRIIYGLFILISGVGGFYALFNNMAGIPPQMIGTMTVFADTGILQMIKATETIAGLMLVFGFLPALAAIFLAPVCVGVVVFVLMTDPSSVALGLIICVLNAYLGYVYWDKYKALFTK